MPRMSELTSFETVNESSVAVAEVLLSDLRENLDRVRKAVTAATQNSGRRPEAVTLVAASKTVDVVRLKHSIDLGQRVFGENKVQESKQKWPALKEAYPDIELHLLGPLQTNKARDAVALFDVIQTVD